MSAIDCEANHLQYATNKSRTQLGRSDEQREQRIVVELDSALNRWMESLPNHCELFVCVFRPLDPLPLTT